MDKETLLKNIKEEIKKIKEKKDGTKSYELTTIGLQHYSFFDELEKNDKIILKNEFNLDKSGEDQYLKAGIYAGIKIHELSEKSNEESHNDGEFEKNYSQIIFYGVPGCGKSNTIHEITKDIPTEQITRVVFHPDYCNADFVGQIFPNVKNGNVDYVFKPGPFSKILWQAYHNPTKKFYLIIEEINRGNAAAIFGEIFQLLDRIETKNDINDIKYDIGWSKYFIANDDINLYLRSDEEGKITVPTIYFNQIELNSKSKIRLPPNLSILATMNTSDQNVFPLDNAFQRRWKMKLVSNFLSENSKQYILNIHCTGKNNKSIPWGKFREGMNNYISTQKMSLSSMEDCQLGSYFIHASENNEISAEDFAYKVLKYLWDDVFRMDRESVFKKQGSFETAIMSEIKEQNFELSKIFTDKVCSKIDYENNAME